MLWLTISVAIITLILSLTKKHYWQTIPALIMAVTTANVIIHIFVFLYYDVPSVDTFVLYPLYLTIFVVIPLLFWLDKDILQTVWISIIGASIPTILLSIASIVLIDISIQMDGLFLYQVNDLIRVPAIRQFILYTFIYTVIFIGFLLLKFRVRTLLLLTLVGIVSTSTLRYVGNFDEEIWGDNFPYYQEDAMELAIIPSLSDISGQNVYRINQDIIDIYDCGQRTTATTITRLNLSTQTVINVTEIPTITCSYKHITFGDYTYIATATELYMYDGTTYYVVSREDNLDDRIFHVKDDQLFVDIYDERYLIVGDNMSYLSLIHI
jgi:hypothetical protein